MSVDRPAYWVVIEYRVIPAKVDSRHQQDVDRPYRLFIEYKVIPARVDLDINKR